MAEAARMGVKYFLAILLFCGTKAQDPILEIDTGSIMGRVIDYKGKSPFLFLKQALKTSTEDPEIHQPTCIVNVPTTLMGTGIFQTSDVIDKRGVRKLHY